MRVVRVGYIRKLTRNGKTTYQVQVVIPPHLRSFFGKTAFIVGLGGDQRLAIERAFPIIAECKRKIAHAQGHDYPELTAAEYGGPSPTPPDPKAIAALQQSLHPVTFASIIDKWAKRTNAPIKGKQDMTTKTGAFAEFLGHDDMSRVVKSDVVQYLDHMLEEAELSPKSVSNHIKLVKRIFSYAAENDHLPSDPAASVKFKAESGEREDFTSSQRRKILTMARESGDPIIYWANWLSSFSGLRTSEFADADTRDVECIDGIWVIKIARKNRSKDQRVKTKVSYRTMPLHSALLAEGFLDYVNSLREKNPTGPLFPSLTFDGYGKRAGQAATQLSDWLRHTAGITNPLTPFYSHRHTAHSFLRNSPNVKEDAERYLMGHAKADVHAKYGEHWVPVLKAAIEVIHNPF